MEIEQIRWTKSAGWDPQPPGRLGKQAQVVFLFSGVPLAEQPALLDEIKKAYPVAALLGCSTAGEIFDTQVSDNALVVTAVKFKETAIQGAVVYLDSTGNSYQAGRKLAELLPRQDLMHVFVLSDGLHVNGDESQLQAAH